MIIITAETLIEKTIEKFQKETESINYKYKCQERE